MTSGGTLLRKQRPVFQDLVKFVRKEARKANDPAFGRDAMKY